MSPSRLAQLVRPPNLVSLARVPLAALFPWALGAPPAGLAVLAAAGASDVLDGWWARRSHQESPFGQVVDALADKVFAASVVASLLATRRIPAWGVPLLLTREIAELVTASWVLALPRRGALSVEAERPSRLGKATTCAQFAAASVAIAAPSLVVPTLLIAGALGLASGLSYAAREARTRRRGSGPASLG